VVAFAIKYISNGKYCGHSIFASFSRAEGLIISDTFNEGSLIPTARIYRSLAELAKEYAGASQLGFPMAVIENSTIITGASNAATAGGFGNLFLQVVRVAQPAVTGPAGPPRDSRQGAPAAW
jgi:hypothetical protein